MSYILDLIKSNIMLHKSIVLSFFDSAPLANSDHPKLQVAHDFAEKIVPKMDRFVHSTVTQGMAMTNNTITLDHAINALLPLQKQFILFVGDTDHLKKFLVQSKVSIPIVWVGSNVLNIFCPTETKIGPPLVTRTLSTKINCQHQYLSRQKLIQAVLPSPPAVTIINGKIVGGMVFGMFNLIAEKFKFKPQFVIMPRKFFPNNNSWAGSAKLVRTNGTWFLEF